jgi:hypothetical protein
VNAILEIDRMFNEKSLELFRCVNAFISQERVHGIYGRSKGLIPPHQFKGFFKAHDDTSAKDWG